MRKRLITVPLLCGALLSLAACGNYAIPDSAPPPSQAVAANPFDAAEEEAGFLGMLTHAAASPESHKNRNHAIHGRHGIEIHRNPDRT